MASLAAVPAAGPVLSERIQRLTHQSSLREKVFEHLLLGQLGVELLDRGIDFNVLTGWSDRDGHDLVIEAGEVTRHIQLKSTIEGTATREVPINSRLAAKAAGCVIWTVFDPVAQRFTEIRWFGGAVGEPLPDLGERAVRHSRGNASGIKAIRPSMRNLALSRFERLHTMSELADRLFGQAPE